MTDQDKKIAEELKRKLSVEINLIELRVFGSRVFETNDPDSDMDIYIQVESLTKEIKNRIYNITWETGYKNNIVITPLIFSKYEILETPVRSSSIISSIYEYGVVI